MEELQIYNIVNDVTAEALGTQALKVTDETGLIALGKTVLDSNTYADDFINTLVKRIGKTIVSYRAYKNSFNSLMKTTMEWGAIVQKIKVKMPTAVEDQSYGLEDGSSVDHYKISKPKAVQKLFITNTPYQFMITIQREHLKDAFESSNAMGSFIAAIFGELQNAIEVALENLGRNCVANRIAETGEARVINLVTDYNTATGKTLTAATAMHDDAFLRYAVGRIKNLSKKMRSLNTLYNEEGEARHTPMNDQQLFVLADFETQLETVVEYAAFNKEYVTLNGFEEVAFWQSLQTPGSIDVKKASDGKTEVKLDNIVATLGDRDGYGMYNMNEWTATTPFNAAGGYYNTYRHEKQLWFNDLSEQFIVFTLN